MPKKEKIVPRTKEQIAEEMKLKAEAKRQREFVKERFYPLLRELAESTTDASMICYTLAYAVEAVSNKRIKDSEKKFKEETLISDLGLEEMFNKNAKVADSKAQEKVHRLFDLVKGEKLSAFKNIVGDFPTVIDGAVQSQLKKDSFKDLEILFLD